MKQKKKVCFSFFFYLLMNMVWVAFPDLESAEKCAKEDFGINDKDWISIDDPLPHCQHNCIHPIRVKGRDKGNPIWNKLEIYDGTN